MRQNVSVMIPRDSPRDESDKEVSDFEGSSEHSADSDLIWMSDYSDASTCLIQENF